MKVTEAYINKKDIKEYELHESAGIGFSNLILFASEQIALAEETYNIVLSKIPVGTVSEFDINDFIIDEEEGLNYTAETTFKVLIDEEIIIPFTDYFVYDGKILFKKTIPTGSLIKISDEVAKTKIITKNSYNNNALFHVFSSKQNFKYNNNYTFRINIPDEKNFNIEFETQFDPYYSNVKTIRKDMGSMINGVSDKQIAQLIFANSKEVFYTLKNKGSEDDLTDIEKNLYPQNVARYKTDIDLCWLLYYAVSGRYGTINKEIGTIHIEKNTKLPYIETMIKRFEAALKEAEDQLNDGTGTVASFTKGGNTSYPVINRGVF